MFNSRANSACHAFVLLAAGAAMLLPISACNKSASPPVQAGPKTFSTPQDAGKALADAAKSQNSDAMISIFGPGSGDIISSGNATQDKTSMSAFSQDYAVMNRWRVLGDGSELLLVGADNQAFPVPLKKNSSAQWYFDAVAGRQEILSRRIGRNENAAIDITAALADAQAEYFSQKHGGIKQYAQKLISDSGQQNGLYWESAQGAARSPIGPLVAFASQEGAQIKNGPQSFYGYQFRRLDEQGPAAKGGAKPFVVNGHMTNGFAYVAYPESMATPES